MPILILENLSRETESSGEVRWRRHREGGYCAVYKKVHYHLYRGYARAAPPLVLDVSFKGVVMKSVVEPPVHISRVPLGAILRFIAPAVKLFFPAYEASTEPKTEEDREAEKMRDLFAALYKNARRQAEGDAVRAG